MPYEPKRLPETPTQTPGPLPWESPELSLSRRVFGTVASTFLPLATIRAVSSGDIAPALRFNLLWALPWMPLWAIMPFTHTLQFKFNFSFEILGPADMTRISLDVARAMLIGVALSTVALFSWAVPFASLLGAFGKPPEPGISAQQAAWRMILYRAWVVPCGLTLLSLLAWSMPKEPNPALVELSLLGLHLLPRILILMHCFAMARYFRIEGLASIAVAVLPLVVEVSLGLLVGRGAELLLPAQGRH